VAKGEEEERRKSISFGQPMYHKIIFCSKELQIYSLKDFF
jgi:hypothetical protein